jgi:membrane associated rhomboid family serine protease
VTATEQRRLFHTFFFPSLFILVLWLIKISEFILEKDFATLGVYPRELEGLPGILLSPLIHGSFSHLIGNSIPVYILSLALFYYYPKISYRVFFTIYIAVGLWVWVAARQSFHIGASGVVYGLAAFHFLSGILRRHAGLMSFSLLVCFLYGSMVWGVLPLVESISWESHLFGAIAGVICAIRYRHEGPQRREYIWANDDDEPDPNDFFDEEGNPRNQPEQDPQQLINIHYEYVEGDKK